ncbi:hypothetical protein ACEPAF_7902 [Sanghuangporus sanghuang]
MPQLHARLFQLLSESGSARANDELLVHDPTEVGTIFISGPRKLIPEVSQQTSLNSQPSEVSTSNRLAAMLSVRHIPQGTMLLDKSTINSRSPSDPLSTPSSNTHHSTSQPPGLSPTILIVLTAAALVSFTILAVGLYCCTRCRKRNKLRSKKHKRKRGDGSPDELEGGRVIGTPLESGRGSAGTGYGVASPSALDFSPPPPNWRPTLPSIAYLSSSATANGTGNGLASGRGEILDAETIMREREPGRRKVYGGGGWVNIPVSDVISVISNGNQATSSALHHVNSFSGQPTQSNTLRVGIGMPAAPALPSHAPRAYRPPAYHRRSRIVPLRPDNNANTASDIIKGHDRHVSGISQAQTPSVPRIEVHPAQDVPNQPAEKRTKRHSQKVTHAQYSRSATSRNNPKSNAGDGLRRNNNSASQSSRPVSGLGISTINLGRGAIVAGDGRNAGSSKNLGARPSSPASPSDEDVRLAYRFSTASAALETTAPREKGETAVARRRSTLKEKRASRHYPTSSEKSRTAGHLDVDERPRPVSRSGSMKRSNTTKRQGLGVGAVDQTIKSELHDMRSLGSESFDSLIAYLDDSVEPEDDKIDRLEPRNPVSHNERQRQSLLKNGPGRNKSISKSGRAEEVLITREETARVEKEPYDVWVGSLNATPSELRLTHVDVDVDKNVVTNGRMSLRAGRRSRSTTESAQNNVQRVNKAHAKADSTPRIPLGERDTNIDPRGAHGRNQSRTSAGTSRNEMQGKVGMHVRALRARSASLKVKNEDETEYLARHGVTAETRTVSGTLNSSEVSSRKSTASGSLTPRAQLISDQGQKLGNKKESTFLSARVQEPLSSLPSFSVPSTATHLYEAFPASEDSSLAFLSDSTTRASGNSGPDRNRRILAAKEKPLASKASTSLATSSSRTVRTSAQVVSSKAISSAAYIARCAPTPHFKSSAVLSFLAPSPSSASRHRLPSPGISRSSSRLSCDTVSTSGSACSAASAWGRRSEWVRESLTPRFDHLRAVLEGRLEETPPPPVPKRKSKMGMR